MFQIEKGIAIPEIEFFGRTPKYPFGDMEIGDSFIVPSADAGVGALDVDTKKKVLSRLSSTSANYAKRHGKKFACRVVDAGVRVWRVK